MLKSLSMWVVGLGLLVGMSACESAPTAAPDRAAEPVVEVAQTGTQAACPPSPSCPCQGSSNAAAAR